MAATAAIRLMTATPQAIGGAKPASPASRATAEPIIPKQPLINRIQAVIVARGLKTCGMFHLFSYFPALCLILITLIQACQCRCPKYYSHLILSQNSFSRSLQFGPVNIISKVLLSLSNHLTHGFLFFSVASSTSATKVAICPISSFGTK
jgi:hypothetical protein